ncbi:MAG: hypothetical protein KKE11_04285, partial [Gammaproteobacteria bacterium]|nr:hypothetical protein [Gammaproteobacteria bacterium]
SLRFSQRQQKTSDFGRPIIDLIRIFLLFSSGPEFFNKATKFDSYHTEAWPRDPYLLWQYLPLIRPKKSGNYRLQQ